MRRAIQAALRLIIGLVLFATAVAKLLDVAGFTRILRSYQALPDASLPAAGLVIPIGELTLSIWLLSGRRLAVSALASAALHLAYAAWSAAGVLRGLRLSNCGCFGVFLARPLGWSTVAEDAVLVAMSLLLMALARGES